VKKKQEAAKCRDCKKYIVGRYYDPVCYYIPGYEGKAYKLSDKSVACSGFMATK
jgi:hypothetical protein